MTDSRSQTADRTPAGIADDGLPVITPLSPPPRMTASHAPALIHSIAANACRRTVTIADRERGVVYSVNMDHVGKAGDGHAEVMPAVEKRLQQVLPYACMHV
jgi:hypothetical protein